MTIEPVSSRLRTTCPSSRAFWRRCAVAFSVCSSAIELLCLHVALHQLHGGIQQGGKSAIDESRPQTEAGDQHDEPGKGLERYPHNHHRQGWRELAHKGNRHLNQKGRSHDGGCELETRQENPADHI